MGIRPVSSIFCDVCMATFRNARQDVREVRVIARQEGWDYDRDLGKDACPECKRARLRPG